MSEKDPTPPPGTEPNYCNAEHCTCRMAIGYVACDQQPKWKSIRSAPKVPALGSMRAEFMAWVQDRGCDTDGAWSAWQGCWNLLRGVPIPPGECRSPNCECEPGTCFQRMPATFHRTSGAKEVLAGPKCDRCNDSGWHYSDPMYPNSMEPCCDTNGVGVPLLPSNRVLDMLRELRTMRDHLAPNQGGNSLRHNFNVACDRLDVLASKLAEAAGATEVDRG